MKFLKKFEKIKKKSGFFSGFFEFFYMDFQWKFLEISDFPKKYFRKMSKIFFLKNKFRSQKIKIFYEILNYLTPWVGLALAVFSVASDQ